MKGLTALQASVLAFIDTYLAQHGIPPTTREITRAFGWRSQTAAVHKLEALEAKGLIKRMPGAARGIVRIQAPASHTELYDAALKAVQMLRADPTVDLATKAESLQHLRAVIDTVVQDLKSAQKRGPQR